MTDEIKKALPEELQAQMMTAKELVDKELEELRAQDNAEGCGEDVDVSPLPEEVQQRLDDLLPEKKRIIEITKTWPFVIQSVTFMRQDKYAGPARYEMKDAGMPFMTIGTNWAEHVTAPTWPEALAEIHKQFSEAGTTIAQRLVLEIREEAEEMQL